MPFFEMKEELYYMICLIIIPLICSTYFYKVYPKKIWLSGIVIVALNLIASFSFYPYLLADLIRLELAGTTIYWFVFILPTQIVSALVFTVVSVTLVKSNGRDVG